MYKYCHAKIDNNGRIRIFYKIEQGKIQLPDAIILATAKYLEADLITDDWDDFQGFDENINILNIADM